MKWNEHLNLKGLHSFLGASRSTWLNYDEDTLIDRYCSSWSQTIGTLVHDLAMKCIENDIKLKKRDENVLLLHLLSNDVPRNVLTQFDILWDNFRNYVNDCIGFRMRAEQILYFSENCFGTADAISFKNGKLRISDLKTGFKPVHIEQLYIYAALFCLEYVKNPRDIEFELRIYQNNEVLIDEPDWKDIQDVIDKIVFCNNRISDFKGGSIE